MRHIPNWIDAYLEHTAKHEPHTRYKQWCAISAIAAVLRRKCYIPWHEPIYPNMYIVLIGPAGGRKGTAMGPVYTMLRDLNINMSSEAVTTEALIRKLSKSTDSVIIPTGGVMTHSSMTLFSKELAVLIKKDDLKFISTLTDWFDCHEDWTYETKTQGTDHISGVWVNLLGATTPAILQNCLPQDAIGGGLTSRILFVYAGGKARLDVAPFLNPSDIKQRERLTEDLADIGQLQGRFSLTDEALLFWLDWYPHYDQNPPFSDEKFAGYCERRPMHLLKLSMILNASRSNNMLIDVQDFELGDALLKDIESVMPNVFAGYGRREESAEINQIINLIITKQRVSLAELTQRFMMDLTNTQLAEILEQLVQFKLCKQSLDENGKVWYVLLPKSG